jgi:cytochrome d ubiquinol oxidase subunit I
VTECGRQPWVVQNIMLVREGATELHSTKVVFSLMMIGIVDSLIFISFLFYLIKYVQKGIRDYPLPNYQSKIEKEHIHRTAWLDETKD